MPVHEKIIDVSHLQGWEVPRTSQALVLERRDFSEMDGKPVRMSVDIDAFRGWGVGS